MKNEQIPIQLKAKGFLSDPITTIVLATFAGMSTMAVCLILHAHFIISITALFTGIIVVYIKRSGHINYTLSSTGIHQEAKPFINNTFLAFKPRSSFFEVDNLVSYRIQKDMTRSMQKTETIILQLNCKPYKIWIYNQKDPEGFKVFKRELLRLIETRNHKKVVSETGSINQSNIKVIEKKRDFYHTPFAKILTIIFVAISLGTIYLVFTGFMNTRNLFRVIFILVPGILYIVIRVFGKKKE